MPRPAVIPWAIQSLYTYSALGRLGEAAGVEVQVDQAGHDVHAVRVDLVVARGGAPGFVDGKAGVADPRDLRDPVALDDDVDGAAGRGARAVDDDRAADDKAVEGAVALGTIGSRFNELGGGGGGEGEGGGGEEDRQPGVLEQRRETASHGTGSSRTSID